MNAEEFNKRPHTSDDSRRLAEEKVEDAYQGLDVKRRAGISDVHPVDHIFRFGRAALVQSEFDAGSAYEEVFRQAPSPKYEIKTVDDEILTLTADNTLIKEYPHFPEYDHVRTIPDQDRWLRVWREAEPDLYDAIKNKGFNQVQLVQPSEADYRHHLNRLLKGSGLSL